MRTKSWKETLIRAGRTFLQAFIAYIGGNLIFNPSYLTDSNALKNWLIGLVFGAIAAGAAAVMNLPAKAE